ncbi:MAG: hypothetical protein ACE5ID_04295, partial [Acidobacteriota bacterium]
EFQSSYNDVLHERFSQGGPQQVKSRDHGNRRVLRPSGKQGRLMVERRADAVLVIQGASRLVLASVSRQVWGHLREKRRQAPDEP